MRLEPEGRGCDGRERGAEAEETAEAGPYLSVVDQQSLGGQPSVEGVETLRIAIHGLGPEQRSSRRRRGSVERPERTMSEPRS